MAASRPNASERQLPANHRVSPQNAPANAPLEAMRRRLSQRTPLEEMGPLFDGPAAPPHREHHSPYR